MNLIVFRHLEPYCYQKLMDGYEVVSLDCSSKDLDAINMYIILIDQRRVPVKSSSPIGAAISSISDRRQKNPNTTTKSPNRTVLFHHSQYLLGDHKDALGG